MDTGGNGALSGAAGNAVLPYVVIMSSARALCLTLVLSLLALAAGCTEAPLPKSRWRTMAVNATAYTSRVQETDDTPFTAAWGHRLKPGTKSIAVSRDLLRMGLQPDDMVRIEGLPGQYRVLDKMNSRYRRSIDIYFGTDLDAARDFGRRELFISWKMDAQDEG